MASALRARIGTALVLAALVLGVLLWLPPPVAVGVIAVVILAGAWEWSGFAGLRSAAARAGYVCAIAACIAIAWAYTGESPRLAGFLRVAALWWVAAFVWLATSSQKGGRAAAFGVGFLVLVPAAIGLARLATVEPNGRLLLLFLLVLVAAADVGAYFGGRSLGRHKLAPRVSPGKTWEGLATGMLAAGAAALVGAALFDMPRRAWLVLCVLVALVSVVGDLIESMFKRHAGLKDSSNLLPGHGGVLDRIDSLTAAGPTFLLGLYTLGLPA